MKIHLLSDLHLEFDREGHLWEPPVVDADVLVLAGDIACGTMHQEWLEKLCQRYAFVLYIPGNHEYYNFDVLQDLNEKYAGWETYGEIKNFTFLHNSTYIIDDVKFIGATLWTDYNKNNPLVREVVRRGLNDYRRIRYRIDTDEVKNILPVNILAEHQASLSHIDKELSGIRDIKRVVITHHAPSFKSVHPNYHGSGDLNFGFYSDLDEYVEKADLWLHGHMHHPNDYMIDKCRVVTNPRGYERAGEKTGYNPSLTIEI